VWFGKLEKNGELRRSV